MQEIREEALRLWQDKKKEALFEVRQNRGKFIAALKEHQFE